MTRMEEKQDAGRVPVIGLAGSPGCGKSTVAGEFAKLGCAVISADEVNRQVLERAEVASQLKDWWGDAILDETGRVDRRKVGELVFEDDRQLRRLEALVHPLIEQREKELLEQYKRDGGYKAVVLDVPLLFEVGQDKWCDKVVFVRADQGLCWQRLRQRGWSEARIKKTENLQLALDIKAQMSDHSIANTCCLRALSVQVAELLPLLLEG
ncbi:MAG: dephospho-CoA kinase [Sedimentisphaerales bacterium]|nr:dephospho-CoA kinase [Sedimentisphaerales bacterium]